MRIKIKFSIIYVVIHSRLRLLHTSHSNKLKFFIYNVYYHFFLQYKMFVAVVFFLYNSVTLVMANNNPFMLAFEELGIDEKCKPTLLTCSNSTINTNNNHDESSNVLQPSCDEIKKVSSCMTNEQSDCELPDLFIREGCWSDLCGAFGVECSQELFKSDEPPEKVSCVDMTLVDSCLKNKKEVCSLPPEWKEKWCPSSIANKMDTTFLLLVSLLFLKHN